jgi:hypothetical protein
VGRASLLTGACVPLVQHTSTEANCAQSATLQDSPNKAVCTYCNTRTCACSDRTDRTRAEQLVLRAQHISSGSSVPHHSSSVTHNLD